MKIAILLTVFNRKDTTIRCLKSLENAIIEFNKIYEYDIDIYITDDGSNDGTSKEIKANFPEINIIPGTGKLFWGGGMNYAWKNAYQRNLYNYYVWLNDDSILFEDSLVTLFSNNDINNNAIIGGAFQSSITGKCTYGGKIDEQGKFILPSDKNRELNYINGNLVLIPNKIFEEVGFIDNIFRHSIGDYDYGLRAQSKGFKLVLTNKYVGTCERHDENIEKCYTQSTSLKERLKHLYSPVGPNPIARFVYLKRHYSISKAMYMFLATNLVTIFPSIKYNNKKNIQ